MVIARPLLVLVSVLAQQYAVTPPNPRPPTEQLRKQHGFEHVVSRTVVLIRARSIQPSTTSTPGPDTLQTFSFIWAASELAFLLALSDHGPYTLARPTRALLGPSPGATIDASGLTPVFLASTCLTLSGGLLRAYCFHVLGTRFTFELAIRPAHALVTDGPYAIVRHPSYTGALLLALGALVSLLDWPCRILVGVCTGGRTALPDESGVCRAMVTGALTCVCATALESVYVVLCKRMDREDAMLEENFGEAWRAWASRVPWRLIPGVC